MEIKKHMIRDREEEIMWSGQMIAMICMVILAVADIREKAVPNMFLAVFGLTAVIYTAMQGEKNWLAILYSLIPGVFLLTVSLCTRESIGYGDGWAAMALGLLTGMEACLVSLGIGLALSAFVSLVLLAAHKVNGKSRLPFLPFLAIGLGVWTIVQKGI